MGDFIRLLVKVLILVIFLILVKCFGLLIASLIYIGIGITGIIVILCIVYLIDR